MGPANPAGTVQHSETSVYQKIFHFASKPRREMEHSTNSARNPAAGGYPAMNPIAAHPNYLLYSLLTAPFAALAVYVAWPVVPIVVSAVVPEVVRAVTTSSN